MLRNFSRRTLFCGLAAPWLLKAGIDPAYKLIAHRGGIVDSEHPENSPGSLQAAIERGYWMVEVDVRRTRDGEPILQHDDTFSRFYGNPAKVEELTWPEISRFRSTPGGHKPIHFKEACAMCEGKIRLMLDIKSAAWPEAFYTGLGDVMESHGLLHTAYMLGGGTRPAEILGPRLRQSANLARLQAAIERGGDIGSRYFFFELANEIRPETVALCHKLSVTPVAAINTFRYAMASRDEWLGPREDAARAKKIGIRHFQIDSRYEEFFRTR
ncbi:MAG: glycerophosphodiester phosphodiesterase family protein [Bryobacterales bacterium]|nr:glycerophosphodiester phosphodiesterase family protein [Bryobacterales bacterium]